MGRKKKDRDKYEIIQNDKEFVVVNKPAGLLAVPIKQSKVTNLQELVAQRYGKGGKLPIKAAHRIDRFTSGLMVFSKNHKSHEALKTQFINQEVTRQYLAVVRGIPGQPKQELVHYLKLIKDGFRNIVVPPHEEGATLANLNYQVVEELNDTALLRIWLKTGLKNQIRVQLNEIGYPLIGDQHYNPKEKTATIDRQALHAERLVFAHPYHPKQIDVEAEIPRDLKKLLNKLRHSS